MSAAELVPSVSIANLLQKREAMAERIREAHRLLMEANTLAETHFGEEAMRGHGLDLRLNDRGYFTADDGAEQLIKEVDGRAWAYLLEKSGLQTFLDAEAREKWRKAIEKNDVPPLTQETIEATFSALYDRRGEMFERGVVEVFRKLSWDYKTNLPRMFGKRIIMRYIVDAWGVGRNRYLSGVSHKGSDSLDDLIRVLSVLDGKPEPDHRNGAWRKLNDAQWMRDGGPNVADLGYLTVKGFKNGNGHLTFSRPDLVDKMNRIIAKHYPNALPPSEEVRP